MPNQVRVGVGVGGVGKASSDLDRLRDKFEKLQKQGAKGFAIGAGAAVTSAGLNLIGSAVGAMGDLMGQATQDASNLNESMSKSRVVFGPAADLIEKFGETSAEAMGLSKRATIEAAATFGNLFVGLDLGVDKAAEMSQGIVKLAADLASFNNLNPEDVLEKLRAGLAGEAEPLRSVGVFLNEAKVKAKAMEMGLADAHGELTDGDKVLARYKLILEETTTAQGDFARTSDGLANTQRRANASLEDARARLGQAALPLETQVTEWQIDFVNGVLVAAGALDSFGKDLYNFEQSLKFWEDNVADAAAGAGDFKKTIDQFGRSDFVRIMGYNEEAIDDFADTARTSARTVTKSLDSMADAFDETWSELSGAAEQAADDIFGPMERRAELAANKRAQESALGVIADPKSSKDDIADARQELLGLQRDYFALMAEMAGRGELTTGELSKLTAALKDQLTTASAEEATSILKLMRLLDQLRAKGKGLFGFNNGGTTADRTSGGGYSGTRASGGPVGPGRWRVGERGPEDLVIGSGVSGFVNPNPSAGGDGALLAEAQLTNRLLARVVAQEPAAARPMTARGQLARDANMMPGARL